MNAVQEVNERRALTNKNITVDTSKISPYRGRAIGRAFYNAYMNFIRNPENEKMLEQCAEEMRSEDERREG